MKNFVMRLVSRTCVAAALALVSLAGCGKTPPPQFHLNMVDIALNDVKADKQQNIANALDAMFGTPNEPFVLAETGLSLRKLQTAAGPVGSDELGRQHGLYRQHCVHCHGTSGDGQGPTAAILNPYPRDYRKGLYKFKSTKRASKPTDADLERIVREGIPGTAMPSFDLLPQLEIEALIEYVKYLSMRGESEQALILAVNDLGENEELKMERENLVGEILQPVAALWAAAKDDVVSPEPKPEGNQEESIAAGRKLFFGELANCVKCHGPTAQGDGLAGATPDFDDWTKPVGAQLDKIAADRKKLLADTAMDSKERSLKLADLDKEEKRLTSLPGPKPRHIQPRNLRLGVYRGGRRPMDLYRRLHEGINGTPMPAVPAQLKPEEIWSLVDYVRSLPYEPLSKPPQATLTGAAGKERM
jgi:mono/diheme cytochrome c family protein